VAVAVTVVLWASAFAAIRAALAGFSAVDLSVVRLLVASLALVVAVPFVGLRRPALRDLPALVVAGALGMSAYQLALNTGERSVSAGTASLLVSTGPIFVALLASVFLRERMTRRAAAGTAIAFAGALVIALGQGGGVALSAGAVTVLGAALSQAAFFVVQKPLLARYSAFEVTAYAMWAGTALLLPFGVHVPTARIEPLIAVALLGVGSSAVGFIAWAYALARLPVSVASSTLYSVPVVAILVALVWLGELPSAASVVGGAIALAGVAVATRSAHAEGDRLGAARRGHGQRVAAAAQVAAGHAAAKAEAP
jgi:drug/metabolite transporter (DMT)-like permease